MRLMTYNPMENNNNKEKWFDMEISQAEVLGAK